MIYRDQADRHRTPGFKRMPTARWTSTSARKLQRARSRIGFRPAPVENSKSCSASMVPRNRCSTRRGSCRTSSGSLLNNQQGARSHEKSLLLWPFPRTPENPKGHQSADSGHGTPRLSSTYEPREPPSEPWRPKPVHEWLLPTDLRHVAITTCSQLGWNDS